LKRAPIWLEWAEEYSDFIEKNGRKILPMFLLIRIINIVFRIYSYLILARIFLTWMPIDPYSPVVQFIHKVTEPVLAPFRIILPLGGMGLDISPIIVFFLLNLLQRALINILVTIAL
jgi:YggT family protein